MKRNTPSFLILPIAILTATTSMWDREILRRWRTSRGESDDLDARRTQADSELASYSIAKDEQLAAENLEIAAPQVAQVENSDPAVLRNSTPYVQGP
jgi:hypothetical protein